MNKSTQTIRVFNEKPAFKILCKMAASIGGRVPDEDTVFYRVFVDVPCDKDVGEHLEYQRDLFLAFVGRFCVSYIWQQEPFNLRVYISTTSAY